MILRPRPFLNPSLSYAGQSNAFHGETVRQRSRWSGLCRLSPGLLDVEPAWRALRPIRPMQLACNAGLYREEIKVLQRERGNVGAEHRVVIDADEIRQQSTRHWNHELYLEMRITQRRRL